MANLAIKGHATRGKEVIEILEILGGKNKYSHFGESESYFFFIQDGIIDCDEVRYADGYLIFTIEEFLEKFPYKVGDKVKTSLHLANYIGTVKRMRWEQNKNVIIYDVEWSDANKSTLTYYAQGLQLYKEETMDKANKAVFDANAQCCDMMNDLIKEETMEEQIKIDIPKGYEFDGVDDNKQQVVFEKIGYQYPKTYEECAKLLNTYCGSIGGYNWKLLSYFQQLLICRNAYWKIAGEQMGLWKPWKPNWADNTKLYCVITQDLGDIVTGCIDGKNHILAFPTEEMRDAFYENFKDLIEQCKELL